VREIQRALGRYRGVRCATGSAFCAVESALIETSVGRPPLLVPPAQRIQIGLLRGRQESAHGRCKFWPPLL